jgi:F-type H+-transporting ATPase subunit b
MKRILLLAVLASATALFAQEAHGPAHGAGHGEEASEGLEVPASLKWANFALLAVGLGYLMGKLLPPAFAKRTAHIQRDIQEAQALKADAERRAAEVDARLAHLAADIDQFRAEAAREMAHEGERIRQETAAQIRRIETQASSEIESAAKAARHQLRRYAADLALKLAEERLRSRMDSAANAELVENFVAELGRQGSKN